MAGETMADVFRAIKKIRDETPDMAWMLDYPEPARLMIQLASEKITEDKFWSEMWKTRFWRTTTDAQRQWRSLTNLDPAKARRQRQEMTVRVRQLMGELGVNLPGKRQIKAKGQGKRGYDTIGTSAAGRVADLALYNGWNEDQVTNYLLSQATWRQEGQHATGGIAVAVNQMRQLEEQYGVTGKKQRRFNKAKQMLGGTLTAEAYEEELRRRAMSRYGDNDEVRGVLERGGTVDDWFDPYRQMIAEELEVPDAEITVMGRRWQEIMHGNREDGRVGPMSFAEAQRWVRSQKEWGRTKGTQEQAAKLVNTLTQTFGRTG